MVSSLLALAKMQLFRRTGVRKLPCLHCLLASFPAFFVHDDVAHSGPLTVPVTPSSLIHSSGGSGGGEQ